MMKHEFETLAGYKVSTSDYDTIIEPMYMALPYISKKEFVAMIDRKRFEIKEEKEVTFAFISSGKRTPNGCFYQGNWVAVLDMNVNIGTGKTTFTVRDTTDDEQCKIGWDGYISSHIDINIYDERCIINHVA